MRKARRRKGARVQTPLGDACEAFLAGRYREHVRRLGLPVPAWVELNRVAHANPAELVLLALGRTRPALGGFFGRADPVSALLADELLALSRGRPDWLARLQRALVDLELELAAHPDTDALPAQGIVTLARDVLRRRCSGLA